MSTAISDESIELNGQQAWLAVVGQNGADFETQGWWCMPNKAKAGDLLLAYRTQRANPKNFGVFAVSKLIGNSDSLSEHASYCSRYGKHLGELHYTKTRLIRRLGRRLSMQEMKADSILSKETCVVRNFQGTTFTLTPAGFARIIELTER